MPLNNKKTFEEFGYHIEDLNPKSNKYIYYNCDNCDILKFRPIANFDSNKQLLCSPCASKTTRWKKYTCNENYFPEKSLQACYWAGFIAADGWVGDKTKKNVLGIKLGIKDKDHLIQFKNDIEYNGVIYYRKSEEAGTIKGRIIKGGESCTLEINSKKIVNDLANIFNIHPRKSLTHEPPIGLTEEQELAFIIGYIDGDGWICSLKNIKSDNYKYPICFGILGTELFLNWVLIKISNLTILNRKIIVRKKIKTEPIYLLQANLQFAYEILNNLNFINVNKLYRKWNFINTLIINKNILTSGEKNKLKTHCKRGHEFNLENTYVNAKKQRSCKTCGNLAGKLRYKQKQILLNAS